jgi:hypothetical protein
VAVAQRRAYTMHRSRRACLSFQTEVFGTRRSFQTEVFGTRQFVQSSGQFTEPPQDASHSHKDLHP